jgi:hypothetical protein
VISQKRLNFRMKRDCKVQDNMGGNGLGNRRSTDRHVTRYEISQMDRVRLD